MTKGKLCSSPPDRIRLRNADTAYAAIWGQIIFHKTMTLSFAGKEKAPHKETSERLHALHERDEAEGWLS